MKSYTDIEQSKKLAEILPLESADMYYDVDSSGVQTTPEVLIASVVRKKDIPCWGLAALLGVLPKEQHPELLMNAHYKWVCNISNPSSFAYKPTVGNNPLDAIFEMIIKLHEQKLL